MEQVELSPPLKVTDKHQNIQSFHKLRFFTGGMQLGMFRSKLLLLI